MLPGLKPLVAIPGEPRFWEPGELCWKNGRECRFFGLIAGRVVYLSKVQWVVMEQLCRGNYCKEIAGNLARSEKTIQFHQRNILKKLGVRNSVELLRLASRAGIQT